MGQSVIKWNCSLFQSKTPALVFEYINNTDFKVSQKCLGDGMWSGSSGRTN